MDVSKLKKDKIKEAINSIINDYEFLNDEIDIENINKILSNIDKVSVSDLERLLTPYIKRIWDYELENGEYHIISWNKNAVFPTRKHLTFATISKGDDILSFCNSDNGIEYKITYDAIIGGCIKDGATIIEDKSKESEFTIHKFDDKVVNSYNLDTKIITPMQLIRGCNSGYKSNHNELLLDSSKIIEIGSYKKIK
jgi:hypothetical protein